MDDYWYRIDEGWHSLLAHDFHDQYWSPSPYHSSLRILSYGPRRACELGGRHRIQRIGCLSPERNNSKLYGVLSKLVWATRIPCHRHGTQTQFLLFGILSLTQPSEKTEFPGTLRAVKAERRI
jgi:hypothetical protein